MSKKYAVCPECGHKFQLQNISKGNRKNKPDAFFDIDEINEEYQIEIEKALKTRGIEFGIIRGKEDD